MRGREDYGRLCRGLLIVNQTFIGRLFIGRTIPFTIESLRRNEERGKPERDAAAI